MNDSTTTTPTQSDPFERGFGGTLREAVNPATVKGAVAVVGGLTVIIFPGLSQTVIEYALGLALVVTGGYDTWFGLTGRGDNRTGSRVLSFVRGAASVGVGLLVLLARQETLTTIILILGFYLLFRGAANVIAGLLGRDRSQSTSRLTIGFASLAIGVLAITSPASVSEGIIITGAVVAVIVGIILLSYGLRAASSTSQMPAVVHSATSEILWDWVRHEDVGVERRETLAETLYFEPPARGQKLAAFWVMLLLSVAIATFAIIQDSTAVVIGAMLIAPLMTPILGLAGALVNGWTRRAASSSTLVALGVAASIGLAFVVSAWVPDLVPFDSNTQVLSRVEPTFVDMLIALAAGAAGAFATVNARVASSIAGVAIAVALVPPLGVVGVALENQRYDDALGAFVLFMTNFVSIVLAAAGVFVLTGFAESTNLRARSRKIVSTLAPFGALALVILVPLVFTAEGIVATATEQKDASAVAEEWIEDSPRLQVEEVKVEGTTVTVRLTGTGSIPAPRDLQEAMTDELGRAVEVVVEFTPQVQVTVSEDGTVRGEQAELEEQ